MLNRRYTLIGLALVVLIAGVLACGPPTPTAPQPLIPPPTVTPYVPPTPPPPQETPPPPTEAPPQETPPSEQPAATETVPPPPPADTVPPPPPPSAPPPATAAPTNTPEPTATPTQQAGEGPLDFDPPQYVCDWEKKGDDKVEVVLCINIRGGTPPFTISHGPTVQGTTSDRAYSFGFEWGSCKSAMVQSITVESSDGQKVKRDYYIPVDNMPWCEE
jgi:outer membrane biosynthesis protein TonB